MNVDGPAQACILRRCFLRFVRTHDRIVLRARDQAVAQAAFARGVPDGARAKVVAVMRAVSYNTFREVGAAMLRSCNMRAWKPRSRGSSGW